MTKYVIQVRDGNDIHYLRGCKNCGYVHFEFTFNDVICLNCGVSDFDTR